MTEAVKNKWFIFTAIALSIVMIDVDVTAVNLALVTISKDLNIGIATAQWIIDGYNMMAAALMAFGGRCGDTFGRKRIFQFAVLVFAAASLGVAAAQGAVGIIAARMVQGASLAFCFTLAAAVIRDIFPKEQFGYAIGLLISIAGLSQALGPSVGGFIIHISSWRWIFLINLPLALIIFTILHHYLPSIPPEESHKLDLKGLAFLFIGLMTLLIGCNEFARMGADIKIIGAFLLISVISLSLFIRREFTSREPLLDLRQLLNRDLSIVLVTRFTINLIYFGWLFLFGLMLQNIFGYSTIQAGGMLLAMTLMIALFAAPIGKIIDRIGFKGPKIAGIFLIAVTCLLFAFSFDYLNTKTILLLFILAGTASSIAGAANAIAGMKIISQHKSGAALGVQYTLGFLGSALGIAMTTGILSAVSHWKLQKLFAISDITLPANVHSMISQAATGMLRIDQSLLEQYPSVLKQLPDMVRQAFGSAFTTCMIVYAVLACIALVFSFFLSNHEQQSTEPSSP